MFYFFQFQLVFEIWPLENCIRIALIFYEKVQFLWDFHVIFKWPYLKNKLKKNIPIVTYKLKSFLSNMN